MRGDAYVGLLWSSAFLVPWALVYLRAPSRRRMLRVSAATSLLGLSEPLFVPRYWNPPSLFDLAQRTGFAWRAAVEGTACALRANGGHHA